MKLILIIIFFFVSINLAIGSEIEFTVHHGPGGPSDKLTRLLVAQMPKKYLPVNRPGAQGRIAVRHLLNNNAIMIATTAQIFVTNFIDNDTSVYKQDDLEIIYVVGIMPSVLVCNNKLGFKTYKEFIANNRSLSFGVAGYGSSEHLATEILFKEFKNNHVIIPYPQGGAHSLNDLLSGHIDCMFANYPLVKEHIKDGTKITTLMSSHDLKLPIPTWQQINKTSFPYQSYLAIVANKKMLSELQKDIINDLNNSYSDKLKEDLIQVGIFPIMSKDKNSILEVYRDNDKLKSFLLKNNIKIN